MKSHLLSAVAPNLSAYRLIVGLILFASAPVNAAEITLVSPHYKWSIDLENWPITKGFIRSGAVFSIVFHKCSHLTVTRPIEVFWENWANSYWDLPRSQHQESSNVYWVELSINHSGNYKRLRGTVVGTGCEPEAAFYIEGETLWAQTLYLSANPSNSVKFSVADALVFPHLSPMVSSDPQKLFYYTGLTPIILINGVRIPTAGDATVVDDQDIRISVNSNGAIRVTGKKVGTFNRNLVVKLILE